ncbi:MAG: hypothetical protein HYX54_11010 [Chloroflexi bacterium]|nr:hypothetical protein [Chloroflexota bacterium]
MLPKSTARPLGPWAALLALGIAVVAPVASVAAARDGAVRATLDGRPIPLAAVGSLYCHDLDYPLIRCFRDEPALRADEARAAALVGSGATVWGGVSVSWGVNAQVSYVGRPTTIGSRASACREAGPTFAAGADGYP